MMNLWFWAAILGLTVSAWMILLFSWRAHKDYGVIYKISFLTFPVIILGLYIIFGNTQQLNQYWLWQSQNVTVQQQMNDLKSPEQLIERLRDHLQKNPNSAQGWYLLGKLYLSLNQYSQAESALQQATQLQPDSKEYLINLAKADFFNHHQKLTIEMEQKLINIVNASPEWVDATNLLAINAYQRKDFSLAINYWQKALLIVNPDSPDSRALREMIRQAQLQQGEEGNGRKY